MTEEECPPDKKMRGYLISDATRKDILEIVEGWEQDMMVDLRKPGDREVMRTIAERIRYDLRVPKPKE